jgi:hypothetical protein
VLPRTGRDDVEKTFYPTGTRTPTRLQTVDIYIYIYIRVYSEMKERD